MQHVEIVLDFVAAVRGVALSHAAAHDVDLTIKTVLTEAFGGPAVRPWSVLRQHGPTVAVVGYSQLDADALRGRLSLATPALRNAVVSVASAPVTLRQGQHVRFSVRLAPVVNVTGKRETDAFLLSPAGSVRGQVYGDYLAKRLPGATVHAVQMVRFRLRRSRGHIAERSAGFRLRLPDDPGRRS